MNKKKIPIKSNQLKKSFSRSIKRTNNDNEDITDFKQIYNNHPKNTDKIYTYKKKKIQINYRNKIKYIILKEFEKYYDDLIIENPDIVKYHSLYKEHKDIINELNINFIYNSDDTIDRFYDKYMTYKNYYDTNAILNIKQKEIDQLYEDIDEYYKNFEDEMILDQHNKTKDILFKLQLFHIEYIVNINIEVLQYFHIKFNYFNKPTKPLANNIPHPDHDKFVLYNLYKNYDDGIKSLYENNNIDDFKNYMIVISKYIEKNGFKSFIDNKIYVDDNMSYYNTILNDQYPKTKKPEYKYLINYLNTLYNNGPKPKPLFIDDNKIINDDNNINVYNNQQYIQVTKDLDNCKYAIDILFNYLINTDITNTNNIYIINFILCILNNYSKHIRSAFTYFIELYKIDFIMPTIPITKFIADIDDTKVYEKINMLYNNIAYINNKYYLYTTNKLDEIDPNNVVTSPMFNDYSILSICINYLDHVNIKYSYSIGINNTYKYIIINNTSNEILNIKKNYDVTNNIDYEDIQYNSFYVFILVTKNNKYKYHICNIDDYNNYIPELIINREFKIINVKDDLYTEINNNDDFNNIINNYNNNIKLEIIDLDVDINDKIILKNNIKHQDEYIEYMLNNDISKNIRDTKFKNKIDKYIIYKITKKTNLLLITKKKELYIKKYSKNISNLNEFIENFKEIQKEIKLLSTPPTIPLGGSNEIYNNLLNNNQIIDKNLLSNYVIIYNNLVKKIKKHHNNEKKKNNYLQLLTKTAITINDIKKTKIIKNIYDKNNNLIRLKY